MAKIWPVSSRCSGRATLAAWSYGLLSLSAVGCTFDTKPSAAADDNSAVAGWMPPSSAGSTRIMSGEVPKVDAARPVDSMASRDAGMPAPDANGARKLTDAGRPIEQPPQRDASSSAAGAAGAAGAPVTPPVTAIDQDASVATSSVPEMKSLCAPGIYEGDFEGPVTFVVGSINNVSGTMRAELVIESSGDRLQVRDGMMIGEDNAGIGLSATWTGTLNCTTMQLENARHERGAWDNGSTFTGTLEGMYLANPGSMSGTWIVESEQILLAGGNGTWRMSLRDSRRP